jgi:hypothetical protein
MTGTPADGLAAGTAASPQAGREHRRGRLRWLIAGLVVVAAAAVVAGVTGAFGGPGQPRAAGSAYPTSTAMVTRQSLSSQTQVDATLGDAGAYSVVNQAPGTMTALPEVGHVVRQGEVLYRVSGSPVALLYGPVPAYRSLSEGMTGPDVAELNADLVTLGYAVRSELGPDPDYFGGETAYALERLQSRLGVTQTGGLALGQAVFLPATVRVTGLGAGTVLGGPARPGATVLSASSIIPVVTIALNAAQQSEIRAGEHVTVTLPDNQVTPGAVSAVSKVATASSTGSSGGSGGNPTIAVQVRLSDPRAVGGLDQAPVEVTITTGRVDSALVVPVDALLARASGGYAVEVTGTAGARHLVPVSPGLFDDADGLVQVTGRGLAAGQHVVVPAV